MPARTIALVIAATVLTVISVARFWPGDASASGVATVDAGDSHTCALTTTGGVKCWGLNTSGQVGDGSNTQRTEPVDVTGLGSGVAAVTAGEFHSCALTTGGGAQCWGHNFSGQLGDGTTVNSPTPIGVSGLDSDVAAVEGGGFHSCALTTAGGVKCWGANDSGQLGNGMTVNSPTPVDVSGLGSGVSALAAGRQHTCALTTAGGVKCWGLNDLGQLGDASNTDRSEPVDVSGLTSGVAAIGVGQFHSCAVTTTGGLKCWGENETGNLGDGTKTTSNVPVDVCQDFDNIGQACNQTFSGASSVIGGLEHGCVLTTTGAVLCWGDNFNGQLGNGGGDGDNTPEGVVGLSSGVSQIAGGALHNCAVLTDGGVRCWGRNDSGQVGDGTKTNDPRTSPVEATGLGPKPTPTTTPTTTNTLVPPTPTSTSTMPAPTPATTATSTPAAQPPTATTSSSTATPVPPPGDADCNGLVTSVDAALILQLDAALILSLLCQFAADVNGDGSVDSLDAALVLQFVVGLIPSLPV